MKVVVHGVTKEFVSGQGTLRALGGINLEVRDQEFFGIIGPTGCGKTTLLHIIAGLETPSTGSVQFVGEQRGKSVVSMVFQESALMPWRNVEENVPLGAEFRHEQPSVYKRISHFFLEVVRLLDFAGAQPHELSGGMKQKVAIARLGQRSGSYSNGRAFRELGRANPDAHARGAAAHLGTRQENRGQQRGLPSEFAGDRTGERGR